MTKRVEIAEPLIRAWVNQFDEKDRADAALLASVIKLVPADVFRRDLTTILQGRLDLGPRPIALFNETERRTWKGQPHRLFKEKSHASKTQRGKKSVRAYGKAGPSLVPRQRSVAEEVGSEGVVANTLTQFYRSHRKTVLLNPGPDTIREERARRFVLVTVFIGSGERVIRYLNSAWRLRTVRSWWSRRGSSGWSFEVVAYAGTTDGVAQVEKHASAPLVTLVTQCPTIHTLFPPAKAHIIEELIARYSPAGTEPLGYGKVGALLTFDHGMPNNAPSILWKSSRKWSALVPARVSSASTSPFRGPHTQEKERSRLEASARASSKGAALHPLSLETIVLSALRRSPRHPEAVSGRLGLTIQDVHEVMSRLRAWGWINDNYQLTERGRVVASRLIRQDRKPTLPPANEEMYFPDALRAPRNV